MFFFSTFEKTVKTINILLPLKIEYFPKVLFKKNFHDISVFIYTFTKKLHF